MPLRIKIFVSNNKNLNENIVVSPGIRKGKRVILKLPGLFRKKLKGQDKEEIYSGMDQLRASRRQIRGAKKRRFKMKMTLRRKKISLLKREKLGIITKPMYKKRRAKRREMHKKYKKVVRTT